MRNVACTCLGKKMRVFHRKNSFHDCLQSVACHRVVCYTVLLLSKLNVILFGYFDPENIFLDNKIK